MANLNLQQPYVDTGIKTASTNLQQPYNDSTAKVDPSQLLQNQAITPSSLQQTTPIQPTVAQPVANPTVPDFLQVNPQEQQIQDQYTAGQSQYADLLSQLAGRDAYTTGQQAQQDVIGKQANVTNYQNQIKALQQEQSGISLQREQNIQAKQQAMSGRGISDSIVNRHSAIDTQYNQQTLTNAIKQYSVGAQLSAAQGDLTSALNYVDQAVKLKYQPIEAQITAQNANLEAIKNNPAFTSAQRKQAAAQQLQLQQYTQQIADEKKAYQDTQDAIIKTVTNNPNITPQQNAVISAAKSPSEVAQLVNYFGLSSLSQQEQLAQKNNDRNFNAQQQQNAQQQANADRAFKQSVYQFDVQQNAKKIADASKALTTAKTVEAKTAAAQQQKEASLPVLDNKLTIIDGLLSNTNGLSSMVGPNAFSRLANPYTSLVSSEKQDFVAGVNQLISQSTLDALLALKAQGGTLGALSEKEGAMLREAASKIGTWAIIKDGQTVGYDTSEKSFVDELNTIKASTQRIKDAINASKGTTATLSPEDTAQIDQLYGDVNPAQYF